MTPVREKTDMISGTRTVGQCYNIVTKKRVRAEEKALDGWMDGWMGI